VRPRAPHSAVGFPTLERVLCYAGAARRSVQRNSRRLMLAATAQHNGWQTSAHEEVVVTNGHCGRDFRRLTRKTYKDELAEGPLWKMPGTRDKGHLSRERQSEITAASERRQDGARAILDHLHRTHDSRSSRVANEFKRLESRIGTGAKAREADTHCGAPYDTSSRIAAQISRDLTHDFRRRPKRERRECDCWNTKLKY
jgi:hypothetical protein